MLIFDYRICPESLSVEFGYILYMAVFKKKRPRYDFAIDDPNEKNYTGHEMSSKNTTNLSEHIIFIASTHL
jgi:hypothetical protein